LFQDSAEVSIPQFLWEKVPSDSKEFLLPVDASDSSSPLATFHTETYNTKHRIIYLKRHREKFCGKTGIVKIIEHQVQQRSSLEQWFPTLVRSGNFDHFCHWAEVRVRLRLWLKLRLWLELRPTDGSTFIPQAVAQPN
jgi:hypothetical protein